MTSRAAPGDELGRASFPVERGKVRELARALFDESPIYRDADAAHAAGFAGIPAPLTYSVVTAHWQDDGGVEALAERLDMHVGRILHGEASWEYLVPVHVGDELVAVRQLVDVTTRQGRRGGAMTIFTTQTVITNQDGQVVIRLRDKLIETGSDR